jgi:peptidoglycan hydrolase CwlO-like protein
VQVELDRLTAELKTVTEVKTKYYDTGIKLKRSLETSKVKIESLNKELADAKATQDSLETAAADLQKQVAELEASAAAAAPAAAAGVSEEKRLRSMALNYRKRAEAAEKVRGGRELL